LETGGLEDGMEKWSKSHVAFGDLGKLGIFFLGISGICGFLNYDNFGNKVPELL